MYQETWLRLDFANRPSPTRLPTHVVTPGKFCVPVENDSRQGGAETTRELSTGDVGSFGVAGAESFHY